MYFNRRISINSIFQYIPCVLWKGGIHLSIFFVLFFQVTSLRSQSIELEDILADLPMVCADVALNIGDLAKQYLEAGQLDSLQFLATYWESYCGPTEPVVRLFNLISLAKGTFNDSMVNDTLMNYVIAYEDRLEITSSKNLNTVYSKIYMNELGNIPLNGVFDQFTREMADKLLLEMPYETSEYLLTLLYSNKSSLFTHFVNVLPYSQLHFGILYWEKKKKVNRYRDRIDHHIVKIWVPFFHKIETPGNDKQIIHAPGVEARMKNRYQDCLTISQRVSDLIITYRKTNRIQEIGVLADFLEKTCGSSEPIYRLQNLLALEKGELTDFSLDKRFFDFAQWFEYKINPDVGFPSEWFNYSIIQSENRDVIFADEFDQELLDWAVELHAKQQQGSFGYLISLFYIGQIDGFYELLQSDSVKYGLLSTHYDQMVNEIKDIWEFSLSASVGSWMPNGNLSIVGPKPTLGFRMGFDNIFQRVDLAFELSFINKPRNSYDVFHEGQLQTSEYFSYGYLGGEYTYAFVHSSLGQIQWLSGIGVSTAETIRVDTENEIPSKYLLSLNVNTGIGFQVFSEKGDFAALQFRYNLVNFRNKEGTNLGGDFVSVNLLLSMIRTNQRYKRKRALRLQGF